MAVISSSFRKSTLVTPYFEDIPRVFKVPFPHKNTTHIYGPYANSIVSFAHYQNYKLVLDNIDHYRSLAVEEKIESGYYNLSIHGSTYLGNDSALKFSYPLKFTKACILVPLEDELPKFYYIIWPFDPYVWLTLLIAIFYIAILLRFQEDSLQSSNSSISRHILQSLAIILNSSHYIVRHQIRSMRKIMFFMLLFVLAFILSVLHQTHMATVCTKGILPPPKTIEDIKNSHLPIYVSINIYDELREHLFYQFHSLWPQILRSPLFEFVQELGALNRSFAYILPDDIGHFLLKQQQQLRKPHFYFTSNCVHAGYETFPLYPNTSFRNALKLHILAVQQAGLWNLWEKQAFDVAVYGRKTKILQDTYNVQPLSLEDFKIGWILLAIGLFLSSCVMVMECVSRAEPKSTLR